MATTETPSPVAAAVDTAATAVDNLASATALADATAAAVRAAETFRAALAEYAAAQRGAAIPADDRVASTLALGRAPLAKSPGLADPLVALALAVAPVAPAGTTLAATRESVQSGDLARAVGLIADLLATHDSPPDAIADPVLAALAPQTVDVLAGESDETVDRARALVDAWEKARRSVLRTPGARRGGKRGKGSDVLAADMTAHVLVGAETVHTASGSAGSKASSLVDKVKRKVSEQVTGTASASDLTAAVGIESSRDLASVIRDGGTWRHGNVTVRSAQ